MRVFYNGCHRQSGHYLFAPGMRTTTRYRSTHKRFGHVLVEMGFVQYLDGGFCPGAEREGWGRPDEQPEGLGALHHVDGWTVWSFWDRTVDRRGNSNSTFVAEGEHDLDAMKRIAAEHFPEVWRRVSKLGLRLAGGMR